VSEGVSDEEVGEGEGGQKVSAVCHAGDPGLTLVLTG
jgi:hypothetical protein